MQWVRGAGGFLWLAILFFCLLALFFVSSSLVPLSLPHAMDFFHVPRNVCSTVVRLCMGLVDSVRKMPSGKKTKRCLRFLCVCVPSTLSEACAC